jgi:carbonic anhydrase
MKHRSIAEILQNNQAWAAQQHQAVPNYFQELSKGQTPLYLYIGCSDSRLPLTRFTQTEPGEIFVHRNIANQACLTDINFLSVLEYAIAHLHVQHIIVCGHYYCGGIQAAFEGTTTGLVDSWVNPIRELYLQKQEEIDQLPNREAKLNRLAELNVEVQVKNLYQTSIMRQALREECAPEVHGWVLDLHSGLIKDLSISTEAWYLSPSCPTLRPLLPTEPSGDVDFYHTHSEQHDISDFKVKL